jgi:ABC-type phosphate transport system auxiliary subunit
MQKTMNIIEQSITPWKIAAHLTVISLLGTIGVFLVGAVVTSHYFQFANKMSYREFIQLHTLAETAFVAFIGAIGVGMTFVANKFADELWDALRNRKRISL